MKIPFTNYLVPVDFAAASSDALDLALQMASARENTTVDVLHTWLVVPGLGDSLGVDVKHQLVGAAREAMATMIKNTQVPNNVTVRTRLIEGEAWRSVVELSDAYDLIVMGTHGRGGLDRWILGSTAERVVRDSKCPVLTVRNRSEAKVAGDDDVAIERVVRAMVDDAEHLRRVLAVVVENGVTMEDVSVVMSEEAHDRDFEALDATKAKEGAAAGGIMAGTVGGILGGLAGLGSIVTTGGLALMVLGPAVGFAAVGGALGGLLGRSVPEDRARVLRAQIVEGRRLVAIHCKGQALAVRIRALLNDLGAEVIDL